MKTAVVCLCTSGYSTGAKVLFRTLEKHGRLPDSVDRIALGVKQCSFAKAVPITKSYGWVKVCKKNFPKVADKFFALTLPYDRIILLDADMLCVGDCSHLWSGRIGKLPFYACRDYASEVYYGNNIKSIGLRTDLLFNAGVCIFQNNRMPLFYKQFIQMIQQGKIRSYDGGDQGYLNHFFQLSKYEIGYLPPEYNYCLDPYMPKLTNPSVRLIHFTGANAKPWNPKLQKRDYRWGCIRRWQQENTSIGE